MANTARAVKDSQGGGAEKVSQVLIHLDLSLWVKGRVQP
jgi:hypothetical protein